RLSNLGTSFMTRFLRLGELRDLEDAISIHRDAIVLTPHGHPHKPTMLNNLANSFKVRFECLREPSDLEDAISLYSHAASVPIGSISVRFRASRHWISCARRIHHPSLLRAYSIAINLFPQLAWIGLSLTHRYAELKRGADVVREAAAAALDSGYPELAVEWLEQGHSIVWGELFQLRGSYEQLSSAHPDHARRLHDLSAALDDSGATREKSLSTFSESTDGAIHRATQTLQQEADRHRTLAIERDKLLQEIRRLPGFQRFLLPKDFAQLRASAHSGPVVMLNAAETRCDALILLADVDHVIHVPLPKFNLQRSAGLQNMLGRLLGDARATPFDDRQGRAATRGAGSWETLLSTLFNGVVKPVLDALAISTVGDLSRIFWCPTGPFVFLPIHAAGLYGTQYSSPGHKVSDFVVSSYVPTLSILTRSPNFSVPPSDDLRLLFVPQPPSDGQIHLQGVARELRQISTVVGNSPSARTTLLESSVGTVEEVLGLMKDVDWVHFACHGIQDAAKPTDSDLCLANGRRLKISDIIGLSRSRGGLAFLSACQTAMGDEGLTDEAIHIAAGMLFAGYGGVIGTMWSISDRLAPVVARGVYEYLFRNGTRPDHRDAARALHEAVGRLRESGEASFVTWVPFIHVGL
ncbi:CHAT domain-containing protein, partial [Boletus edulis]